VVVEVAKETVVATLHAKVATSSSSSKLKLSKIDCMPFQKDKISIYT
jgi:hypothetical protein